MTKKFIALLLSLSLIGVSVISAFAASERSLFITDAKAGEVAKVFANGPVSTDLTVIFVGPQGRRTAMNITTDNEGRVNTEISAPERAGEYEAYISGMKKVSTVNFLVTPSREVSIDESGLRLSSKRAFADGEDVVEIKVIARDEDGQSIEGLSTQLLSEDEVAISPRKMTTDEHGYAVFTVRSSLEGAKTVYAYDGDGTSIGNATIQFIGMEPAYDQVAYPSVPNAPMYPMYPMMNPMYSMYPMYAPQAMNGMQDLQALNQKLKSLESILSAANGKSYNGGDYLGASLLDVHKVYAEGIDVDHFEIIDLDEVIEIGEPISFTVRALDINDELVEDYEGEVTFSSTDDDTLLPTDYAFEPADLGEHEFTLALTILNEGEQTLTVADIEDQDIEGEIDILIGDVVTDEGPVATIILDAPLTGTYASTSQTVAGATRKDSTVTIFDGASVVGSVNTDDDGNFNYQVTGLSEGKHELHILSEHIPTGEITDSEKVEVTIDVSPPVVNKITLDPSEPVEEGDSFSVAVETETESVVSVILNNLSYDLTEQTRGSYSGQIIAPQEMGDYSITIITEDKFGNEGTYPGEATLVVKPKKKPVTNVLAVSNEEAVSLDWDIFQNAARYKISFGKEAGKYTQQIVTIDSTPSWVVRNLEGGTDYYIQIEALNSTGQVVSLPSQETSARSLVKVEPIPAPTASIVAPPQVLQQPPSPDQVTQTGPEMYLVLLASLLFLDMYARVRRKLKRSSF